MNPIVVRRYTLPTVSAQRRQLKPARLSLFRWGRIVTQGSFLHQRDQCVSHATCGLLLGVVRVCACGSVCRGSGEGVLSVSEKRPVFNSRNLEGPLCSNPGTWKASCGKIQELGLHHQQPECDRCLTIVRASTRERRNCNLRSGCPLTLTFLLARFPLWIMNSQTRAFSAPKKPKGVASDSGPH